MIQLRFVFVIIISCTFIEGRPIEEPDLINHFFQASFKKLDEVFADENDRGEEEIGAGAGDGNWKYNLSKCALKFILILITVVATVLFIISVVFLIIVAFVVVKYICHVFQVCHERYGDLMKRDNTDSHYTVNK